MYESIGEKLFVELSFSHQIIRRMQRIMTAEQCSQLHKIFDEFSLPCEGNVRESERLVVLEKVCDVLVRYAKQFFS